MDVPVSSRKKEEITILRNPVDRVKQKKLSRYTIRRQGGEEL
jgi:hypothetical protein